MSAIAAESVGKVHFILAKLSGSAIVLEGQGRELKFECGEGTVSSFSLVLLHLLLVRREKSDFSLQLRRCGVKEGGGLYISLFVDLLVGDDPDMRLFACLGSHPLDILLIQVSGVRLLVAESHHRHRDVGSGKFAGLSVSLSLDAYVTVGAQHLVVIASSCFQKVDTKLLVWGQIGGTVGLASEPVESRGQEDVAVLLEDSGTLQGRLCVNPGWSFVPNCPFRM